MKIKTTANYTSGIVGYVDFQPGDENKENPIKYNLYLYFKTIDTIILLPQTVALLFQNL